MALRNIKKESKGERRSVVPKALGFLILLAAVSCSFNAFAEGALKTIDFSALPGDRDKATHGRGMPRVAA